MKNIKTAGALLGAGLLATAGVAGAVPALAGEAFADGAQAASSQAMDAVEQVESGQRQASQDGSVSVPAVEGAFSYDQAALTPSGDIAGVFAKAASAVCASLPDYCACVQRAVAVSGPGGSFEAAVADMAGAEGAQSHVMGCACASNVAGGGAVANAEVSGVALASVAELAGAL